MRIECNVSTAVQSASGDYRVPRSSRGFVGLGKKRMLDDVEKFFLLVKTRNKEEKFSISKQAVQRMIRLTNSNRATIIFSRPSLSVFISEADPQKLDEFMAALQQVLDHNILEKVQLLEKVGADCSRTVIEARKRKMSITCREDYPRGDSAFPTSLVELRVSGTRLKSADLRWFTLKDLLHLDISNNRLGEMSEFEWKKFANISRLSKLATLNLNTNGFKFLPDSFFDALPSSLQSLDLSDNSLENLSNKISRLYNLRILTVSGNMLTELPEDIFLLRNLECLDVSKNHLVALPACLFAGRNQGFGRNSRGFNRLDVSMNAALQAPSRRRRLMGFNQVASLCSIAAAAALNKRIPTDGDVLPRMVERDMRDWLQRCGRCLSYSRNQRTQMRSISLLAEWQTSLKCILVLALFTSNISIALGVQWLQRETDVDMNEIVPLYLLVFHIVLSLGLNKMVPANSCQI
uniref:PIF1/LRR1 pleckstrin homology domain-containing protein n=1 Tax=Ditylenchus dipsaci TaxID=166011 RepID=A0A915EHA4_9BILA